MFLYKWIYIWEAFDFKQNVFSLILFLIVKGTEISLKSVAVTYYFQDIDFEKPYVAVLYLSKVVFDNRYIYYNNI